MLNDGIKNQLKKYNGVNVPKLIDLLKEQEPNIKEAEKLLESYKSVIWPEHITPENQNPLHLLATAKEEKLNFFISLIQRGCPFHTQDIYGFAPIHYARIFNHKEIFSYLLRIYKENGLISPESLTGSYVSLTPREKRRGPAWLFSRKGDSEHLSAANVEFIEESTEQGYPIKELLSFSNLSINNGSSMQEELESMSMDEEGSSSFSSKLEYHSFIKMLIIDSSNVNNYALLVHKQGIEKEKFEKINNKLAYHLIESGLFFKSSDIVENKIVNKKTTKNPIKLIKNHSKPNFDNNVDNILISLFLNKEVVEPSLCHLSPQNIYDMAIGLCQIFEAGDILDSILKIWPKLTNTMKPLCVYFCMPVITREFYKKNITEKEFNDFSKKMDKLLNFLNEDILSLKEAGKLLKKFYIQAQKAKDIICDIEIIEKYALQKKQQSALSAEMVADDLIAYHRFLCSQLGASLEDIKKPQSFKVLVEFESSALLSVKYNQLNFMIVREVLEDISEEGGIQEKNSKIDFYLNVAKNLYEKKEYHFLHAIIASLSCPEITRIPQIESYLSENPDYDKFKKLFAPEKNYKDYRKHLKENEGFPFWGVILRDLIHLQEVDKNISYYLKLGEFYTWFDKLKWSSQKQIFKPKTDFFHKMDNFDHNSNFDNEYLWKLSYQIVPKTINLAYLKRINSKRELHKELEELIDNISKRIEKQVCLEIIDTDIKKTGEEAHNALFEFVRAKYTSRELSYKDSRKLIALSVKLLNLHKPEKEYVNLLHYLTLLNPGNKNEEAKHDGRLSASEANLIFSEKLSKQYKKKYSHQDDKPQEKMVDPNPEDNKISTPKIKKRRRRLGILPRGKNSSNNQKRLTMSGTGILPPGAG